jgi:hypothetical protein
MAEHSLLHVLGLPRACARVSVGREEGGSPHSRLHQPTTSTGTHACIPGARVGAGQTVERVCVHITAKVPAPGWAHAPTHHAVHQLQLQPVLVQDHALRQGVESRKPPPTETTQSSNMRCMHRAKQTKRRPSNARPCCAALPQHNGPRERRGCHTRGRGGVHKACAGTHVVGLELRRPLLLDRAGGQGQGMHQDSHKLLQHLRLLRGHKQKSKIKTQQSTPFSRPRACRRTSSSSEASARLPQRPTSEAQCRHPAAAGGERPHLLPTRCVEGAPKPRNHVRRVQNSKSQLGNGITTPAPPLVQCPAMAT